MLFVAHLLEKPVTQAHTDALVLNRAGLTTA